MSDFTILSSDQIYDEKKQLEILKKKNYYDTVSDAVLSDFAAVLGQQQRNGKKYLPFYWTSTLIPTKTFIKTIIHNKEIEKNKCAYVAFNTSVAPYDVDQSLMGTRVAIKYSSIKNECENSYYENNIKIVEYGEYPQHYSDTFIEQTYLEDLYNKNAVEKTGKKYTVRVEDKSKEGKFIYRRLDEYEYKGHKYVRYEPISFDQVIVKEEPYWFLVEPIKWLVDEKTGIAVSKNILFSGVCLNDGLYYGDFENSYLKKFLDNYFSKEIVKNNGNNYEENSIFEEEIIDEKMTPIKEEPIVSTPISPLESKKMQRIQNRVSEYTERANNSLDRMDKKSDDMIKKSFGYSEKNEEAVSNKGEDEELTILSSSNPEEISKLHTYKPLKNGDKISEHMERANISLDRMNKKSDDMIKKNSNDIYDSIEDEELIEVPKHSVEKEENIINNKARTVADVIADYQRLRLDNNISRDEKDEKLRILFEELAMLRKKEDEDNNYGSGPKF